MNALTCSATLIVGDRFKGEHLVPIAREHGIATDAPVQRPSERELEPLDLCVQRRLRDT